MRNGLLLSIILLIPAAAVAADDGAAIYKSKCAMCHGADGRKNSQPMNIRDLTSPEVQAKSDEELIAVIAEGKGKMPPFKNRLSAEEIEAVVAHLRALAR